MSAHAEKTFEELTQTIKNKQAGATTAGQIRDAGGQIVYSPTKLNPDHYLINGLTGQQLESLFAPNVKIIVKRGGQ